MLQLIHYFKTLFSKEKKGRIKKVEKCIKTDHFPQSQFSFLGISISEQNKALHNFAEQLYSDRSRGQQGHCFNVMMQLQRTKWFSFPQRAYA